MKDVEKAKRQLEDWSKNQEEVSENESGALPVKAVQGSSEEDGQRSVPQELPTLTLKFVFSLVRFLAGKIAGAFFTILSYFLPGKKGVPDSRPSSGLSQISEGLLKRAVGKAGGLARNGLGLLGRSSGGLATSAMRGSVGVGSRVLGSIATTTVSSGPPGWIIALVIVVSVPVLILFTSMKASSQSIFLPTDSGQTFGSQFIDVQVNAVPKNVFNNNDLPQEISFEVNVSPKEDELTNVDIKSTVVLNNESGSSELRRQQWSVVSISNKWSVSFDFDLEDSFSDTLIINTIVVEASVSDQSSRHTATNVSTVTIGNPPQDCPGGWPTDYGYITQGPYSSFSHRTLEAIDIGVTQGMEPLLGKPARATHRGTVTIGCGSPGYGRCVIVTGSCLGKTVHTFYAHLQTINVSEGQVVFKGDKVGGVGNTGNSTAVHLHYEFRGLQMLPPYIPTTVKYKCDDSCSVSW